MSISAKRTFDDVASRLRSLSGFADVTESGKEGAAFFYEDWLSSSDATHSAHVERGVFTSIAAFRFAKAKLPSEAMLLGLQNQEGVADWIGDSDSSADVEYAMGKNCAAVWLRAGGRIQLDVAVPMGVLFGTYAASRTSMRTIG